MRVRTRFGAWCIFVTHFQTICVKTTIHSYHHIDAVVKLKEEVKFKLIDDKSRKTKITPTKYAVYHEQKRLAILILNACLMF